MGKYNLPTISDKHRWYLKSHSKRYAKLRLQKRVWWGWSTQAEECVAITGSPLPVEVAIKQASDDIVEIINAPKIEFGVIS